MYCTGGGGGGGLYTLPPICPLHDFNVTRLLTSINAEHFL